MKNTAAVVRKLLIQSKIKTKSPLRIGSGTDDGITDILILKDKHDNCFIPGTSVAGVLRTEIEDLYGIEAADFLFGCIGDDEGNQSMINISDIVLKNANIIYRDGVAIDYVTGTGIDGAKYDYEAVERGAKGTLDIEVTVRAAAVNSKVKDNFAWKHEQFKKDGDFIGDMLASIADILTSGINVGSLTAKGYGKIAAKDAVKIYDFNFAGNKAADNWLNWLQTGKLPAQAAYTADIKEALLAENDFVMTLACALRSSLLIREDISEEESKKYEERKLRINSVQMKSSDDYVIPGTSIKGVLRNAAFRILMALSDGNETSADLFLNNLMGYANEKTGKAQKSRLFTEETYISEKDVQKIVHSRNRIDRFTGGTIEAALFTDIPVWQNNKNLAPVIFKITIKNCTEAEAGLLLLLLKEIWFGNINIGSGKAVGRGILYGRKCSIAYKTQTYSISSENGFKINGSKEQLENYVKALAGELNGK